MRYVETAPGIISVKVRSRYQWAREGRLRVKKMTENQIEWARKRDELVAAIKKLGFSKELGL